MKCTMHVSHCWYRLQGAVLRRVELRSKVFEDVDDYLPSSDLNMTPAPSPVWIITCQFTIHVHQRPQSGPGMTTWYNRPRESSLGGKLRQCEESSRGPALLVSFQAPTLSLHETPEYALPDFFTHQLQISLDINKQTHTVFGAKR